MTSITWASLRYVQEAATILGSQNRTQGSCVLLFSIFMNVMLSIYVIISFDKTNNYLFVDLAIAVNNWTSHYPNVHKF